MAHCAQVYQVDMKGAPAGPDNPFNNAFYAHKTLLETEKGARAMLNGDTWRTWKIENPSVLNRMGDPVRLLPMRVWARERR